MATGDIKIMEIADEMERKKKVLIHYEKLR
jgi:hypothetical protein